MSKVGWWRIFAVLLAWMAASAAFAADAPSSLAGINLTHLNALRQVVKTPSHGEIVAWWVYAASAKGNAPAEPYRLVPATGEGVSCVDDVARAALVYLKHGELAHDAASFQYARECFAFLRALRAPDGTYYNWLRADGTPNTTRGNSLPGLNFWTARAVWALGEGCRTLKPTDPKTAKELADALAPILQRLDDAVTPRYPTFKTVAGQRVPTWLVGEGSDITATFLLGLCAYEKVYPSQANRRRIRMLAEGVAAMQGGDATHFPWFGFRAWTGEPDRLHGWGSHQMASLVAAASIVHEPSFVAAAARCAENFTVAQLASDGPIYAYTPAPVRYEQIAYAVEPTVMGLLALADATGKPQYRDLAIFAASWLFGNNLAAKPLYDLASGRGYDALQAGGRVNDNSGAESTIEALYTLLLLRERHIGLEAICLVRHGGQSYTTADVMQPALQYAVARAADGRQMIVAKSWVATPMQMPVSAALSPGKRGAPTIPPFGYIVVTETPP